MQANQTPALVTLPFATNGLRNTIPEASQAGIVPGAASLNDGFPPATMQPKTQGGIPPDGKDFNGILFILSAVARWMQAGGTFVYDPAFASNPNLGGYPKGAVLLRADLSGFWFNTADNNTTNPDASDGSARGWLLLNADWNATVGPGAILNRPALAKVATSGSYADLAGTPPIPPPQVNADWAAASGIAAILNKPAIPAAQVNADWNAASGVAAILNKPAIPPAQINADWNATSGVAAILNKPAIPPPPSSALGNPGYLEIPTPEGTFLLQWGTGPTVNVPYNDDAGFSGLFPLYFPSACRWCGVSGFEQGSTQWLVASAHLLGYDQAGYSGVFRMPNNGTRGGPIAPNFMAIGV